MAQPTPYVRQFDFSDHSEETPELPHSGTELDAEFDLIDLSLGQTQTNLALIQRDDGALANQTVGAAQLTPELLAALGVADYWETATAYIVDDRVFYGNAVYICLEAHTSGTFATDLAAADWQVLVDFSGDQFQSTSTTSLAIGAGTKIFTVDAGKSFNVGSFVLAVSQANPANFMFGTITTYTNVTLTTDITLIGGSGTLADWLVTISGARGATGATGAAGTSGNNLGKVSVADTTPAYLSDKIVVGAGLATSINNPAADEEFQISLGNIIKTPSYIYAHQTFN